VSNTQPNILLIMSDQHNKHVCGCYGDTVISTPHIDALASEGVVFDNAYCPFPLCAPSRMSFMTGRGSSDIGMYENSAILHSHVPTFAHLLGGNGYDTALCGRMHFNGPDQRHGFQRRLFPEVTGTSAGMLSDTPGFMRASLEKSGPGRNHYLLYDRECVESAVSWLIERRRGRDRPFCLVVGLVGPHCPYVCPPELFWKYYEKVPLPNNTEGRLERLHPYNRRFIRRSKIDDATETEIRRTRAAYYGMVEFDDQLIGLLLDALRESSLLDETVVIYTSDHGDMLGEHGMLWKMSFYEASVGIPLVVRMAGSDGGGRRVSPAVSLIDLAPTLTDIAGTSSIPDVAGKSLVGYLQHGHPRAKRDGVYSELMIPPDVWTVHGPSGGPGRMLRKGRWKFAYYHGEDHELYDIESDPEEVNDLAADPEYGDICDEMREQVLAGWDPGVLTRAMSRYARKRNLVGATPPDPGVLAGEYWEGPEGYGYVEEI